VIIARLILDLKPQTNSVRKVLSQITMKGYILKFGYVILDRHITLMEVV